HAVERGILTRGRDLLGRDALALEHGDHRVAEAIVSLDGSVDPRRSCVRSLKDLLANVVLPVRGDLVTDERPALAVGLASLFLGDRVAPNDGVVALGEVDRVGVGVLPAVESEDLRTRYVPGGDAVLESLTDQFAHLDVVEADVVGVRTGERCAVVADDLDAVRLRVLLDLRADGAVERVHDQYSRAI